MSFAQLFTKYQSPTLIVYCDRKHPDYKKILKETFKARQAFPLEIVKKEDNPNRNPNHDLKKNLLFIVSTQPMLIPLLKLANKSPRCILAFPEYDQNDVVDLRDSYWKNLKKIDGMPFDEFFKRVAEKSEIKKAKTEDERESAKAKFSEDRFKFTKAHSFSGKITAEKIEKLVEGAEKNKLPPYFESEELPKEIYSEIVVGEDLKKKILTSDHDCVVFLEHPNSDENRGYSEKYEKYVKKADKSDDVKYYRIKDFNEIDVFKLMNYPSPSVLYFKKGEKANPRQLDIKKDLVKGSNTRQAFDRLSKFINKNSEE